ncbi:MAG: hypothetical protein GQ535_11335 [Rhodobacteraceae bacterium]|nr:hypothetical protein [Paracoccaceae bacterium]
MMGRNTAILAWGLACAVYLAMLVWTMPALTAFSGGQPVFDMLPAGYTFKQALALIDSLGEEGRAYYLDAQHKLDTVYPPLLAISFALSFRLLFRRKVAFAMIALAVSAAGFDLLENAAVSSMLSAYPSGLTEEMVGFASRLTIVKSVLTTLAFIALLVGLARAIWRRFSRRTPRPYGFSNRSRT